MPSAAVPAAIGAVGDIVGGGKAASSQQQSGQATSALANEQVSAITSLLNNYLGTAAPALDSFISNPLSFQQPEIQAVTNTENAANTSLLNTEKAQLGGIANPNQFFQGQNTAAQQSTMQSTQSLSGDLVSQWLQGIGLSSQPLGSALGGLSQTTGMYNQDATAAGASNPYGTIGTGIGGLVSDLPGIFGGAGTGAGGGGGAGYGPGGQIVSY